MARTKREADNSEVDDMITDILGEELTEDLTRISEDMKVPLPWKGHRNPPLNNQFRENQNIMWTQRRMRNNNQLINPDEVEQKMLDTMQETNTVLRGIIAGALKSADLGVHLVARPLLRPFGRLRNRILGD